MSVTEIPPGGPAPQPISSTPSPPPQSSLRSISLVTGLSLLQLLLQFGLQLVLARQFGAAGEMDAFVAALALPVVIATILAGSLGYVLVPIVAEQRAAGSEMNAAAVASQIGFYLTLLSLAVTGVAAAAAVPLMTFLCPGFSAAELALATGLLRILSLLILANSLIAYLNALYHSYRQFAWPAMAGVVGTLVTLVYVLVLHSHQGIFSVAYAIVIGAAVTVIMLLPLFGTLLWESAGWKLPIHSSTWRCLSLLMPLVVGTILWRLDPLLDRYLGSKLPTGSIAHMGFAWRLISGLTLIGTSGLSIVTFPAIAAHAASQRRAELNAELAYALRFFVFLMAPVCIGLTLFAQPVVRLLFERGRFVSADTAAVSLLVVLYVGVIFGSGLSDVLSRTFYALSDTTTPVFVCTVVFLLAAAAKVATVGSWQAPSLVIATSAYYLLNAVVLLVVLSARLSRDIWRGVPAAVLRATISSLIACLMAGIVTRLPSAWAVLPASACGAAVYLLVMWVLRDEFALRFQRRVLGGQP